MLTKKVVGRGDFFEIREANVKGSNEIKAVKIYRKLDLKNLGKAKNDLEARDLVERELKLLAKIDHPNIMKVLEAFED